MTDDNDFWQWLITMTDDNAWWQWLMTLTDANDWWASTIIIYINAKDESQTIYMKLGYSL